MQREGNVNRESAPKRLACTCGTSTNFYSLATALNATTLILGSTKLLAMALAEKCGSCAGFAVASRPFVLLTLQESSKPLTGRPAVDTCIIVSNKWRTLDVDLMSYERQIMDMETDDQLKCKILEFQG